MPTYPPPRYKTDREECNDIYLGHYTGDNEQSTTYDLYAVLKDDPRPRSRKKHLDTLIARYGDSPPDYISGYQFALNNPYTTPLSIAFIRLLKLDLIDPPKIILAQDLPSTTEDVRHEISELATTLIFYCEDTDEDQYHHRKAALAHLELAAYSLKLIQTTPHTNPPQTTP